jgi:hypothetical protein
LTGVASLYRRKNLVRRAPDFAQGMYDWSLATAVNHVTAAQVKALVGELPNAQVLTNGNRVEVRIGL